MVEIDTLKIISGRAEKQLGFKASLEEVENMDELAEKMGLTRSKLIRLAIIDYVARFKENKK